MRWFLLDVNPEPWAIGPVGYSRRGGKMSAYVGRNQQLDAYKEAVRESLTAYFVDHPEDEFVKLDGKVMLVFYFWRNRAEYETPQARRHRKHEADVTNLQKATEDALQGILFENDRDVALVQAEIREQGPDVIPCIIVGIDSYIEYYLPPAVEELLDQRDSQPYVEPDPESNSPVEDVF